MLGLPDSSKPYLLESDASDVGVRGKETVLSQVQDGSHCVTQKELLALIKAVKNFWPYSYGRFKLRTDHASFSWLSLRNEPVNQVVRGLEILPEFHYTLER